MTRQSGFTLIEVLVAVIVMAIGLLGLAGMQLKSLKNNQRAQYVSDVTLSSLDIIDRMRANRKKALNGDYSFTSCTGASGGGVVAADLAEWCATLVLNLPGGDASVAVDINNIVTVTVTWNDGRNDTIENNNSLNGTQTHIMSTEL